jgi:Flp pilus assembly protein TadG
MTKTVRIRERHRLREQRGQALVEFAIVLIPLLFIVLGIVEFGFWFQAQSTLRDGVRAAAREASLCRSWTGSSPSPTAVYHSIVDSTLANAPDPTIPSYTCTAGTAVTVQGTYPFSVNILGIISIPTTALKASAEAIVE